MLQDLKELEKFFKLCRKQGITEIQLEGVSVKFGDLPFKSQDEKPEDPMSGLSADELIFYAAETAGIP